MAKKAELKLEVGKILIDNAWKIMQIKKMSEKLDKRMGQEREEKRKDAVEKEKYTKNWEKTRYIIVITEI